MILRPQLSSRCEYVGHICLDCDDNDDMFTNMTSTLVFYHLSKKNFSQCIKHDQMTKKRDLITKTQVSIGSVCTETLGDDTNTCYD